MYMTAKEEFEGKLKKYRKRLQDARDKLVEASSAMNDLHIELQNTVLHSEYGPEEYADVAQYNALVRHIAREVYGAQLVHGTACNYMQNAIDVTYAQIQPRVSVPEPQTQTQPSAE